MISVNVYVSGARNIRGHGLRIRNLKAQIRSENGRAAFPHDIEGVLEIAGLPKKNMKAKLLKGDRSPSVLEVNGKSKKKMTPEKKVNSRVYLFIFFIYLFIFFLCVYFVFFPSSSTVMTMADNSRFL